MRKPIHTVQRPTNCSKEELLGWLEVQVAAAERAAVAMDAPPRRPGESYGQAVQNAHRRQIMTLCAALGAADALCRAGILSSVAFDHILSRLGAKLHE